MRWPFLLLSILLITSCHQDNEPTKETEDRTDISVNGKRTENHRVKDEPRVDSDNNAAVSLSLKELGTLYKENEVGADYKFKGKRIILTGYIVSIKSDESSNRIDMLLSEEETIFRGNVVALCGISMEDVTEVSKYKLGNSIALSGIVGGKVGDESVVYGLENTTTWCLLMNECTLNLERFASYRAAPEKEIIKVVEKDGLTVYLRNGEFHREDGPAVIYSDGTKEWWINGKLHRENGPAIITKDGAEKYYENGQLHKMIFPDGSHYFYSKDDRGNNYLQITERDNTKRWYRNELLHRDSGPALILPDKSEYYYQDGELHRENNRPAVILANGSQFWYSHGKLTNQAIPGHINQSTDNNQSASRSESEFQRRTKDVRRKQEGIMKQRHELIVQEDAAREDFYRKRGFR